MTDTVEAKSSLDLYLEHYEVALGWLEDADKVGRLRLDCIAAIAAAQVHATLAQAIAVTRLVDSYNGWKELGR